MVTNLGALYQVQDGHTDSFNGHRKAYWVLYRKQDGQAKAYNRYKASNMTLTPVTTGILGLIVGIGKSYGPYIRHRTIKLDLIPDKRQPPYGP